MEETLEKIKKEINSLKKQLEVYGDSIRIKDVIAALNRIYYIDEPITVLNNTDNSVNAIKNTSSDNTLQVGLTEGTPLSVVKFKNLTNKMSETYERKNHDYGDSFNKSLDKFGLIASVVRMNDKMERIESLMNKEALVKDESIKDTLLDLASYCVMTTMWLDNNKNSK